MITGLTYMEALQRHRLNPVWRYWTYQTEGETRVLRGKPRFDVDDFAQEALVLDDADDTPRWVAIKGFDSAPAGTHFIKGGMST